MNRYGHTSLPLGRKTHLGTANWQLVLYLAPSPRLVPIPCKLNWQSFPEAADSVCSDVLRRRFQINAMSGMGYQYKSIPDAIRTILSQEGLRGLYKGLVPNLLKVAPSMASSWLAFEVTRDFLVSLGEAAQEENL